VLELRPCREVQAERGPGEEARWSRQQAGALGHTPDPDIHLLFLGATHSLVESIEKKR
jgi:hypothetical protein